MTSTAPYFTSPEIYDLMYAGFIADIPVMVDEAKAARGPALEVCCGSGRLLLPIREAGVEIDGVDYDPRMVECLRERLAARRLGSTITLADMRDFTLPRRYAYVFIGFNSFLHNLAQDDQIRTLRCCREHLEEGGTLGLMMFHPYAQKLVSFDGSLHLAIDVAGPDGGRVHVYDGPVPDRVEQINDVHRRVDRLDASGRVTDTHEYDFQIRYVYKPEMELLLRVAGFKRWTVCSPISGYAGERYAEPRPPQDGGILLWRAYRD